MSPGRRLVACHIRRRPGCCRWLLRCASRTLSSSENVNRVPAPIHPVPSDKAFLDLHYLDQIHLIAFRRRTRIFPGHCFSICEIAGSIPLSLGGTGLEHQCDEVAEIILALDDSLVCFQEVLNEMAFYGGVICVKRQRSFQILFAQRIIPQLVNPLDFCPASIVGGLFLRESSRSHSKSDSSRSETRGDRKCFSTRRALLVRVRFDRHNRIPSFHPIELMNVRHRTRQTFHKMMKRRSR